MKTVFACIAAVGSLGVLGHQLWQTQVSPAHVAVTPVEIPRIPAAEEPQPAEPMPAGIHRAFTSAPPVDRVVVERSSVVIQGTRDIKPPKTVMTRPTIRATKASFTPSPRPLPEKREGLVPKNAFTASLSKNFYQAPRFDFSPESSRHPAPKAQKVIRRVSR